MEEQQYLIDTNVVIDYLGNKLPPKSKTFIDDVINTIPNVSIITKIEVLGFNAPEEHYNLLLDFMNDSIVFELSPKVTDICIQLRKKYKTKLPDAIIAATAITYDLILISRNISDFKSIESIKVINPYEI